MKTSKLILAAVLSTAAMYVTVARAQSAPAAETDSSQASPDQVYLLYGRESRDNTSPQQRTFTFQLEYMHDFNQDFSWSYDYGNQGHFNQGIEHHRDYQAFNLWAHTDLFDKQLRLAVGAGPLFYYDTTGGTAGNSTEDVHGFGASYTAAATLYSFQPLLLQVRGTFVQAGSFNTKSIMLGVGYQLDGKGWSRFSGMYGESDDAVSAAYGSTKNEVTIFGGKSIINLSGNGHANAYQLEYRHDVNDYLQWTVGALDEGKSSLADRKGITGEVWADKKFFDNRLSLGLGAGLYLADDSMKSGGNIVPIPITSVTAAFQLTPHLTFRTTWDRPLTNYNRDSDIFLFGIGYRY